MLPGGDRFRREDAQQSLQAEWLRLVKRGNKFNCQHLPGTPGPGCVSSHVLKNFVRRVLGTSLRRTSLDWDVSTMKMAGARKGKRKLDVRLVCRALAAHLN